ncbi:MAG: nucleotidyltransferase domain-containing protein [Streptococcus sp.]|uniref:nucleotidyltransferase domain-containing protein n=1 Tax=Streptococcus sp. TaxID=1306 RepID=UPI002582ED46|nr:nucleotidyltransferase domain-containing protein [Streptococcus sp.]MCR5052028.1 nucleotidyltransferase domain-containing protein [Streptococcus sp.]
MEQVNSIIDEVVNELKKVSGVEVIVLGGSRARGIYSETSDIDIGIYYNEHLDFKAMNEVAKKLDSEHRDNLLSAIGIWGPWVNAWGWLRIVGYDVDIILRDINRVESILQECKNGEVSIHYQPGHPHGFSNVMYIGELAIAKLLWQKDKRISDLKQEAESYPEKMKQSLIHYAEFESGFSIKLAEKSVKNRDTYYLSAHIVRAISQMNQLLFAVNDSYCLNEKRAVEIIETLSIHPSKYSLKVNAIFSDLGNDNEKALVNTKRLLDEIIELK